MGEAADMMMPLREAISSPKHREELYLSLGLCFH